MIHQPSGGAQGTAADIEIQAREILYLRTKMNSLYALHTGQPMETIERDMDRDRFMSAEEAKAYGLIDTVFAPRKAPETLAADGSGLALDAPRGAGQLSAASPHSHPGHGLHVQRQAPALLVLREVQGLGPEVHFRPVGLHLQRVHHPLQRDPGGG